MVTRYLRTINSEFVVNGKTFKSFQKLEPQLLNQVAVALFLEAIKEKLVNNVVVQNVLSNSVKLRNKRRNLEFAYEAFYDKMKEFFKSKVPIQEIVDKLCSSILDSSTDRHWSKDMVIDFFSYSHFIENPYNDEVVGLSKTASLTPLETMWYFHYRDEDVSGITWFEDLLKFESEPSFSIVEDTIQGIDFSSMFTDIPIPDKGKTSNQENFLEEQENIRKVSEYLDNELLSKHDHLYEEINTTEDHDLDTSVEDFFFDPESRAFSSRKEEKKPVTSWADIVEEDLNTDCDGHIETVETSENPVDVYISPIMLPVLKPDEVLDAKEFKRKIVNSDTLKKTMIILLILLYCQDIEMVLLLILAHTKIWANSQDKRPQSLFLGIGHK